MTQVFRWLAGLGGLTSTPVSKKPKPAPKPRAKLTPAQVREIRLDWVRYPHLRVKDLAKAYTISPAAIQNIVRGSTWADVRVPEWEANPRRYRGDA